MGIFGRKVGGKEAFCPTGAGGGVDPSCAPGKGSGGGKAGGDKVSAETQKRREAAYDRTMREPEKVFKMFEQEKGGHSDAAKAAAKHIADKLVVALKFPGEKEFGAVAKAVKSAKKWGATDTASRDAIANTFQRMGGTAKDARDMFDAITPD